MDAINLVDGLKDRNISFNLFRTALHQKELAASQGWERTTEKLVGYLDNNKTADLYSEGLTSIYSELTLYGDKALKLYTVDEGLDNILSVMTSEFKDEDSPYAIGFPLPLDQADLIAAPLQAHCVACWEDEYATNFVICSKQFIVEREELPTDSLNDEALSEFGVFDEMYGVRKRAIQLFDVISIKPEARRIEIKMDGLRIQRLEEIEKRCGVIRNKVSKFVAGKLGVFDLFVSPINFFPAISKLYEAADGRVGELGHSTESAAIHHGKMRRKAEDFRNDKYHDGGLEKIRQLNAYMISK